MDILILEKAVTTLKVIVSLVIMLEIVLFFKLLDDVITQ